MFVFSYSYTPYIAVIGDIVSSKRIPERKEIQDKLTSLLNDINKAYPRNIASQFMITLGDEFQGLLHTGDNVLEMLETIEREMHPVKMRFGIGVGGITTDINPEVPLGADGPAYHHARRMIQELKSAEKKKMESKLNMKIEIETYPEITELVNTIFTLNTVLKEKWTDRQRQIIGEYLKSGGTQSDTAKKLDIHQSNVQRALAGADFYAYHRAIGTVTKILSGIGEKKDV
ncbi:MAG: hypothetical protein KBA53_10265 [Thermoclostridium sp.]|nr:hypothetical protein [Thermoclostridium sp.]